jgi:outer membrane protein assembly factor BamD (BamD/ComL family)
VPRSRTALALLAAALGSCATTAPVKDPIEALVRLEESVTAGRLSDASVYLASIEEGELRGEYLERYRIAKGRTLELDRSYWSAFLVLRDFVKEHPFSPFLADAKDIIYRLGLHLLASDKSFLFFSSDKDDALYIFEYFLTQFPKESVQIPSILHALGDEAFRRKEWTRAIQRYQELMREHPESEWVDLARFRVAMCHYFQVRGPDYDMEALQSAFNELAGYLKTNPENPEFLRAATVARDEVAAWIAEKDLAIALFYHRIGKPAGYRFHLQKAATEHRRTEAGERSARLLAELAPAEGQ